MKFTTSIALFAAAVLAAPADLPICGAPAVTTSAAAPAPAAPKTTSSAPAAPAAPAKSTTSSAAAPAATTSSAASSGWSGIITIHSGNSQVHQQTVGLGTDNKLTLGGPLPLNIRASNGGFEVQDHGFLDLYQGYLEAGAAGASLGFTTPNGLLAFTGEQSWVVCPSDGNTIKWSSDNCKDAIGVQLQIV